MTLVQERRPREYQEMVDDGALSRHVDRMVTEYMQQIQGAMEAATSRAEQAGRSPIEVAQQRDAAHRLETELVYADMSGFVSAEEEEV